MRSPDIPSSCEARRHPELNPQPPRPATPQAEQVGRLADGIGAVSGGGVAGHHLSVPNAIKALIDPFRKYPFAPVSKPTNAFWLPPPSLTCEVKPCCLVTKSCCK
jgi:hypothetical protein